MYNTDTGSYKLDKPIFILSIDENREVLKNAITQSLAASKQIKFVTSDNSALLKDLREKSFQKSSNIQNISTKFVSV